MLPEIIVFWPGYCLLHSSVSLLHDRKCEGPYCCSCPRISVRSGLRVKGPSSCCCRVRLQSKSVLNCLRCHEVFGSCGKEFLQVTVVKYCRNMLFLDMLDKRQRRKAGGKAFPKRTGIGDLQDGSRHIG